MNIITQYPKFRIRKQWVDFANMLRDENGKFIRAIVRYGLNEEETTELSPQALEYFNGVVRPDLDRQHNRMKKGQKL